MALLVWTRTAAGAELDIAVQEVRNDRGHVLVAVCTEDTFLQADCPHTGRAAAAVGEVVVTVRDIPPGTYAVQAFHDENDNAEFDRNLLGVPLEGIGFSNDAPMDFGPPHFEEAAIGIAGGGHHGIRFRMRYLDGGDG